MKTVYQVVDGDEVFLQVPLTVTAAKSGKVYNVHSRIRSDAEFPATHAKAGEKTYTAEFYVIQDHFTKIIPTVIAYVTAKGSVKDGTRKDLSANAKIVTISVDDSVVDSTTRPPTE